MERKLISVFLIAWMLLMIPMRAFAQEFDPNRTGSVSVTLMDPDGETPVAGAELSLYRVAAASLNSNDNLSYTFTAAFADCGFGLEDPDLTAKLDAFVKDLAPAPETAATDAQGKVQDQKRQTAAAAAKSLQSCPTLCDPVDGSPPGSPVPGILQARTLEWAAI